MDYTMTAASGTTSQTINLPQDTDNITCLVTCTVFGATTDDIYFQTSNDGGTTWYDMGNCQVAGTIVAQNARIANFSTVGVQARSSAATNSVITSAAASTVGANLYTGVPILGIPFRVFHKVTGSGANTIRVQVYANNQSATA